jgi:multidrug transporter EmrE-like cation transporter
MKMVAATMGYVYIIGTIFFTVYGQLVIKWQMAQTSGLPALFSDKVIFLLSMFMNLWVVSAFASAFLASLCWMAAMTKFDLSFAYPFMSTSFILVLVLSGFFFHEPVSLPKLIGICLITVGIVVSAQG